MASPTKIIINGRDLATQAEIDNTGKAKASFPPDKITWNNQIYKTYSGDEFKSYRSGYFYSTEVPNLGSKMGGLTASKVGCRPWNTNSLLVYNTSSSYKTFYLERNSSGTVSLGGNPLSCPHPIDFVYFAMVAAGGGGGRASSGTAGSGGGGGGWLSGVIDVTKGTYVIGIGTQGLGSDSSNAGSSGGSVTITRSGTQLGAVTGGGGGASYGGAGGSKGDYFAYGNGDGWYYYGGGYGGAGGQGDTNNSKGGDCNPGAYLTYNPENSYIFRYGAQSGGSSVNIKYGGGGGASGYGAGGTGTANGTGNNIGGMGGTGAGGGGTGRQLGSNTGGKGGPAWFQIWY